MGPRIWTGLLLAAFLLLAVWALIRRAQPLQGWDTTWRRYYLKHFGLVFHLATLTFAAVHLSNFVFSKTPYWLLPLLCCRNGSRVWRWAGCGCAGVSARPSRCTPFSTRGRSC